MSFAEDSQLKEIGAHAFSNTSLAEVHIPASVQNIGEDAFCQCKSLECALFAKGSQLREIRKDAFA